MKSAPLRPTYKYKKPFACWSVDYLPKLPVTQDGYKHCLIMVDVFSKWVELFPMKSKQSSEVWEVMLHNVFYRYGSPYELRFDRGTEFAGVIKEKCAQYGIKRSTISTQHP